MESSFKELQHQYQQHKYAINMLTGSIASDQLILRLLQSLKKHAEAIEDAQVPDDKYSAFIDNLDYTVDQKALDRAIQQKEKYYPPYT